ncbi:hypothetical protein HanPI659440_Chr15g0610931 [Helianthus annuus]|nr:hypothetical protein HanPI659440_Chr15g0610931 [Helianthus annuus]
MDRQPDLEVKHVHNQVGYLSDPPAKFSVEFKLMIVGLNTCKISYALRDNPMNDKDMIQTFWKTASINRKGANGRGMVEATIQKKTIIFSEAVVREVLLFGDKSTDPTVFSRDAILGVLPKLSYGGTYPPTIEENASSLWRLLIHMFLQCIAINKGVLEQLNQVQTCVFVDLIEDWGYNFSAFVF